MASCATTQQPVAMKKGHGKEYFSESEYGVKASPRVVAEGQPVPKGGGRFMIGDPYEVRGKTYVPKEDPKYNKNGLASWYGSAFHGRYTANGEIYDSSALTAASPTFPLPSYARVTNLENGSSIIVRVNDRGPYHEGRILDVSGKTADMLDIKRTGTAHVNVKYLGRARMDGLDMPMLMASYVRKGDRVPSFNPGMGDGGSGVMVASNQPLRDQMRSYGSAVPQSDGFGGSMASPTHREGPTARTFQALDQRPEPLIRDVASVQSAPMPVERQMSGASRSSQRAVASAGQADAPRPSMEPQRIPRGYAPQQAAPSRQYVASAAPRYEQRPVVESRAVAEPRRTEKQVVAQARPTAQPQQYRQPSYQQPSFQQPVTETAYAATPRGNQKARVMFGNVLLQD